MMAAAKFQQDFLTCELFGLTNITLLLSQHYVSGHIQRPEIFADLRVTEATERSQIFSIR